ncbi:MAG: universal stress protein [Gammaproteobacteria bacterium]|nr:universal stress protein [Gammaproteobacteria bacterium]NND54237.1 universal stress protein [Gammaproteobacteria bacterium]
MSKPTVIVVPTDFSAPSWSALNWIAESIGDKAVAVHCIHVLRPVSTYIPPTAGAAMAVQYDTNFSEIEKNTTDRLGKAISAQQARFDFKISGEVLSGSPARTIAEYAEDINADMIVMSGRGYNPIEHFLLGDTAEDVVRRATCPVVTLKRPPEDKNAKGLFREEFGELREELKRTRDELNGEIGEARDELREEWDELEGKWESFNQHIEDVKHEAEESRKDIGSALALLGEELKHGYERVRKAL